VGTHYTVARIDEKSASLNYRVQGAGQKPVLLRIHRRISTEHALVTLQAVQRHVFDSGVFGDSRFNECLLPLRSTHGGAYEQFKGLFVEVYPFAENVEHYSGDSLAQVESLAARYGSVQKALQRLSPSVDLGCFDRLRPEISWFEGDKVRFDRISDDNAAAMRLSGPDRFDILFHQHRKFLNTVWREIEPHLGSIDKFGGPLLHDLHPHNTFYQSGGCVLIYDYEATSRYWSHSDALAFAVHRFVREYIRSLRERKVPRVEEEIPKVVDTFLEHYASQGLPVPPTFTANLGIAMKITNLGKLLYIMADHYNLQEDRARRQPDILYAEAVKFLAYLQEAECFASR
jgi:hypothetical protein